MSQPQPVRRIEPPPRFPNRNDRGPELILRSKEERRWGGGNPWNNASNKAAVQTCRWIPVLVGTETASAGDQENVHLHASVPETVLREETARHDGPVEWFLATQSSSPNLVWIGELRWTLCLSMSKVKVVNWLLWVLQLQLRHDGTAKALSEPLHSQWLFWCRLHLGGCIPYDKALPVKQRLQLPHLAQRGGSFSQEHSGAGPTWCEPHLQCKGTTSEFCVCCAHWLLTI